MYRGLFFADLHVGAMSLHNTEKSIENIKNILKDYTKDSLLDFIILGGDFFDKQFYANDLYIPLAQKLMLYFLLSSKTIRVIYGTSSHDSNQYQIFDVFKDVFKDHDFRVIYTAESEELLPDMKVLYVPEEYIYYKKDFYKDLFKEEYDYVFGHGMIEEAFTHTTRNTKEEDHSRRKPPVFKSIELSDICRGDVIFGHYHIHDEYGDGKVSYAGSFDRWKQNEEKDKGFYYLEKDEDSFRKEFIVNPFALKYITKHYGYHHPIFMDGADLDKEVKRLFSLVKKNDIYELRLMFNIPLTHPNPESFMKFWRERLRDSKNIRVEFSHGYVENERKLKEEKVLGELDEERKIILDKNIPGEDKISYFLKKRRGIDMSPERIKELLEKAKEK